VITEVRPGFDRQSVHLQTGRHRPGFLYEVRLKTSDESGKFWPVEGFYWMKKAPK
jgi:hypothetical protein